MENTINQYELQAVEFLEKTKSRIFATAKSKESGKYGQYIKYKVCLIKDSMTNLSAEVPRNDIFYRESANIDPADVIDKNKGFIFEFSDSVNNCSKGLKPNVYDILACLSFNCDIGLFEEWCLDFGYDTDSRKAYDIYQACLNEHLNLKKLFTQDELEILREIS
jgi:hypothetical protein